MSEQRYIPSDVWVICDYCGFRYRMSQTRKTWDGYRVCEKDWYPKHPQLNVKGVKDVQAVKDPRPDPPDVFIESDCMGWFLEGFLADPSPDFYLQFGNWFCSYGERILSDGGYLIGPYLSELYGWLGETPDPTAPSTPLIWHVAPEDL